MLIIRREQMRVFEQAAMARFEEEMVVHCRRFPAHLGDMASDAQVRLAVQGAIRRCGGYGFTNRGPIRLFIEMTILFGCTFDTDPQYAWSSEILRATSDQMVRAERLYDRIIDYQDKVPGFKPTAMNLSLENLPGWAEKHASSSLTEFSTALLREMGRVLPAKASYVGAAGLTDLILEGSAQARKHGVSTVFGRALMGMIMFAFGHGFMEDSLHPWTKTFLEQKPANTPEVRAACLQKAASAFLAQMTAASPEGKMP
jgi:hypothetical protein